MKNVLEIQEVSPEVIQTVFYLVDNSKIMELHRRGLTDEKVLVNLLQRKYYQHKPGTWQLTFPRQHRVFDDQDFAKVVQKALLYIHERDHPDDYDGFY